MHQLSLVRNLKEQSDLIWVMQEKDLTIKRKSMGWSTGTLKPDYHLSTFPEMKSLIDSLGHNFVHVFGGFCPSKEFSQSLNYCLRNGLKTYVQTEAFDYTGLKGRLRLILLYLKKQFVYRNRLTGIFAIGKTGINCFSNMLGYDEKLVHPFGYFIESKKNDLNKDDSEKFKIIFVGQLIYRKGVDILLEACKELPGNWQLLIIGDGKLYNSIKDNADYLEHGKIRLLRNLPNPEVQGHIAASDLLVLPSRWDGWGAVVSEALMQGTPVVATNRCGSSMLLQESWRGSFIESGDAIELRKSITERILAGKVTDKQREKIKSWSTRLSGDVAADYMINVIKNNYPINPWI